MFILLIIGGMLLIFAIILFITRMQYIRNGIITEATVANLYIEKSTDAEEPDKLFVTFKYYMLNNEEILHETDDFSSDSSLHVGDIVPLVYQKYNPQRVIFLNYWGSFGVVTILFSMALVLILIGAGYYWSQHFFNNI